MAILRNARGAFLPWDREEEPLVDMPLVLYTAQSNTVTKSVLIDRMLGTVYPLIDSNKKERVMFRRITQTVRDQRFRSQRLLSLNRITTKQVCKQNKRTILISLSGVIVTTGARHIASAVYSMISNTRVLYAYRVPGCRQMCHATVRGVNTPFYGMFKHRLNLHMFHAAAQCNPTSIVVYDPDVFPGARFRVDGQAGVALLYKSGKFVIIGLTSRSDLHAMLRVVYEFAVAAFIDTAVQDIPTQSLALNTVLAF